MSLLQVVDFADGFVGIIDYAAANDLGRAIACRQLVN